MAEKRVIFKIPAKLEEQLIRLKKEKFYDKHWTELYRHLLAVGAETEMNELKKKKG